MLSLRSRFIDPIQLPWFWSSAKFFKYNEKRVGPNAIRAERSEQEIVSASNQLSKWYPIHVATGLEMFLLIRTCTLSVAHCLRQHRISFGATRFFPFSLYSLSPPITADRSKQENGGHHQITHS